MNTAPQAPLIPDEPQWLVREKTQSGTSKGDDLGPFVRKVTVELVWGTWVPNKSGRPEIVGETFHILHGPTAYASMEAMAKEMNAKGQKPPESKVAKTRLDGFKQTVAQAGGDSLFDAITLKETISYDPKK